MFLSILFILSNYVFYDVVANSNEKNIKLIKEGMSVVDITNIMGIPYEIEIEYDRKRLSYKSPFGYSGDYDIYISLDSEKVTDIYLGL